jgi:hypothetical protein
MNVYVTHIMFILVLPDHTHLFSYLRTADEDDTPEELAQRMLDDIIKRGLVGCKVVDSSPNELEAGMGDVCVCMLCC